MSALLVAVIWSGPGVLAWWQVTKRDRAWDELDIWGLCLAALYGWIFAVSMLIAAMIERRDP